jgi:hypothetical protein
MSLRPSNIAFVATLSAVGKGGRTSISMFFESFLRRLWDAGAQRDAWSYIMSMTDGLIPQILRGVSPHDPYAYC